MYNKKMDEKTDEYILPRVFLNKGEETEIRQCFPWVFDNEIAFIKENGKNAEKTPLSKTTLTGGCAVNVFSFSGCYEGTGIFNKTSKITVRFLVKDSAFEHHCSTEPFGYEFFLQKVRDALALREPFYEPDDSYRLVFGEADFLPGFIAERYADVNGSVYLVVQFLALCTDVYRDYIVRALSECCAPCFIYERSDAPIRQKEGLPLRSGWIGKAADESVTIKENGVLLKVNIASGQKTGYFLDQKENRKRVALLAKDKEVLDAFTHTGAFGLNAVLGGAKQVTAVDISEDAVLQTEKNIELNGAQKRMMVVQADVFDLLKRCENEERRFDMIILDPPAFAKNAQALDKAYGGYKEINLRALKLLRRGGILVSCSCSQFMEPPVFYSMLSHAARDAKKQIQIMEKRGAGPDHPVPLGYAKAEYLKCAVCRVL